LEFSQIVHINAEKLINPIKFDINPSLTSNCYGICLPQ